MKIALRVAVGLALLVLGGVAVGLLLPVEHQASRERAYAVAPEVIFLAITAPAEYPRWRSGVERVEILPEETGKVRFRELGSDGAITYVFEEMVPTSLVVTRIADPSLPFGGAWTFDLTPVEGGTLLRITEDGEVYNPIFRFVSRFVMGHHASIERYLADLGRLVEPAD